MAAQECYFCATPFTASGKYCPSCGEPRLLHDRYQLEAVLGRGGFGVVYQATDTRLSRHCAIKVITYATQADQQGVDAEASILSQHASRLPFIPDIYDRWLDRNQSYLVMEYIDGETLASLLGSPWQASAVEDFLRTLLTNLVQLHQAGIIHRDLKPENIKRTPQGRYMLLDFGLAKQGGGTTLTGGKAASLYYASPEQYQGWPTDARSDLYSLAATAYHLLTGVPPTPVYVRVSTGEAVTPPQQLVPDVPIRLDRLLMQLLEVDAAARVPDAQAALHLLDAPDPYPGSSAGMPTERLAGPMAQGRAQPGGSSIAQAFLGQGHINLQAGNWTAAVDNYTQAIRLNPDDALAYRNRAWALINTGLYDLAIADSTAAIRLDPEIAEAYNYRGWAYGQKGQYDQAMVDCTEAIRLNPEYALAYTTRGWTLSQIGQYDQAIADLSASIRLNPAYPYAHSNRAWAYQQREWSFGVRGQYDLAITDYSEAIRLNPNDALAYRNRGWIYGQQGQYDETIADCTEAIRLNPGDALAYSHRGWAYTEKGDKQRATADYTQVIHISQDATLRQRALKVLADLAAS